MTNDELRGAIYTTRALLTQAADALQENVDSLTKSHTDPVTGLVDDEARLSIESDQDLIDRLRAAAVPVCQKPEPVQPVAWYEHNPDLDAWFLAYTHNPKVKSRPLVFGDTTPHAQPAPAPIKPIVDPGLDVNQRLAFKLGWKSAEEAHGITKGQP
jgi:hypothetical protein